MIIELLQLAMSIFQPRCITPRVDTPTPTPTLKGFSQPGLSMEFNGIWQKKQ